MCAVMIAGCDPPPLTDSGVVGVFGKQGLGTGEFSYPRAISIAPDGKVFVIDKSARVQRFSPDGQFEHVWSMPEKAAGKPVGLTIADDGRVFIADTHYHRVIVFDRDGTELARFGKAGFGDGEFQLPTDVALDAAGNIYVSEYNGNDRVTRWTPDFQFDRVVCAGEYEGKPIMRPSGIDIDHEQTLWVADAVNHRIIRLTLEGEILSIWGDMGRKMGQLRYPYDIQCLDDGSILVCEYANNRLQWFDANGQVLRAWGQQGRRLGDLWAPWGVAVGPNGLVYALDSLNARVQIIQL